MTQRSPFRHSGRRPTSSALRPCFACAFPCRPDRGTSCARGIGASHETSRCWWPRLGRMFAAEIRRGRAQDMRSGSRGRWHLDEALVTLDSVQHHLWRAGDHEGEVLEALVSKTRDGTAALTVLRKPPKRQGRREELATDKLRSCAAALTGLCIRDQRVTESREYDRAEHSHQPFRSGGGSCRGSGACTACRSSQPSAGQRTASSSPSRASPTETATSRPAPSPSPGGGHPAPPGVGRARPDRDRSAFV